jgi:predicted branched-subunit amino acid permease
MSVEGYTIWFTLACSGLVFIGASQLSPIAEQPLRLERDR